MIKPILFLLSVVLLFTSCGKNKKPSGDSYSLVKSGDELQFELDSRVKNLTRSLFLWEDADGKEYVTFQNDGQNHILAYDLTTQELAWEIKPQVSGSQGVNFFFGYHIHTPDSIFLTNFYGEEMVLIDREARITDKFNFSLTEEGIELNPYESFSANYRPLVILDDKLYIMPDCNRRREHKPVCATIGLYDKRVNALPFEYFPFPGSDNMAKSASAELAVSRCFTGKVFAYSFHYDEDLYVTAPDHQEVCKIPAKSKYIPRIKILDDYGNVTFEDGCTNPNYGNMYYDPYREVFYRVCYPETQLEQGINGMELLQYGRKNFSILILDKDFHTIGETMFPDYTYNSIVLFINRDGLYISSSHYLNPQYDDDILSFQRFDLVKNK